MFNPIFQEDIQGRKHPGSCAFAEPEPLSYRNPKHVVQKVKNDHKKAMIVTTIMMKVIMKSNYIKGIVKGAPNATQHHNNANPKTSPIDCDGVAEQCIMSHGTYFHIMI